MTGAAVLRFENLSGGYGDTIVVRELSAEVPAGQVLGVLGRNGVGKSTLMRLLMGYAPAATGGVFLNGRAMTGLHTHWRQRSGMSFAPQEGVVFDQLTVAENLTLHRNTRDLTAYEEAFELFPRIKERLAQRAGSLSGGEKKIVSFVRALAERAAVTLLDEPSEGVQPENINRMASLMQRRCAEGHSFVLVEQNLSFLLAAMHRLIVLDHGKLVASGEAAAFDRGALEAHLHV
jgi:ABC-type branched-subunit amino acid transport system ATPase component